MSDLHLPKGSAATSDDDLVITPESAGWTYSGLFVFSLAPGAHRSIATGETEICVLPMSGSCIVTVAEDDAEFELAGRASVFERVSDFAYVGIGRTVQVSSEAGGQFAVCSAKADISYPAKYGPAEGVAVEVRGGGAGDPSDQQLHVTGDLGPC